MRITELRVKNFRQFYGEQCVQFATESDKNVTVIHGFNGSGKTALLNAFVWCLYGEVTPDLEAPKKMANELAVTEAVPGQSVSFEVELKFFDNEGNVVVVKRSANAMKHDDGTVAESPGELTVYRADREGEFQRLSGAQNHVDRYLPKDLYPFFFFNGERVERLASKDAYSQVEGGIKTLLNVAIFERGVSHLRGAIVKELENELRQYGSEELNQVLEEKSTQQNERQQLDEQLNVHRRNIAACDEEIERIDARQAGMIELTQLVERRGSLQQAIDRVDRELDGVEGRLKERLSDDGFLAFGAHALTATEAAVREARKRGDLPAKVKPQFVDDLLHQRVCICGRDIAESSAEETTLRAWRSVTGLAQLEEAISQVSASIGTLRHRRTEFFRATDDLRNTQSGLLAERRGLSDQLDQVKHDIGDRSVDEEAADLDERRRRTMDRRGDERLRCKQCEDQISQVDRLLSDLERRRKKLSVQSEKGELARRQLEAVENVASALEQICELQKQDVRRSLDRQIAEIWMDAAVKDYAASISPDFRLELSKQIRGKEMPVHGASTGEKQVLALSFVGALVRKSRANAARAKDGKDLVMGGEYPLVMDSPFGSLERDYQQKVAHWVPSLASQVVVMASKSQWTDEVEGAMRKRIGREYILELHTPKDGADQNIDIGDRSLPYVKTTSDDFEQTVIQEVE